MPDAFCSDTTQKTSPTWDCGQREPQKPQKRLGGRFWIVQKLCEDAGKLGMPQATDTAQKIWLPALQLCENAY